MITAAQEEFCVPGTQVQSFRTQSGNEYQLLVALPDGTPPHSGWPTPYLLDGQDYFASAVQIVRRSYPGDQGRVVAGLGYRTDALLRRADDYMPTPQGNEKGLATDFLRALQQEILPALDSQFPLDPGRRVMFGHSYGGLFRLHTLLQDPELFWGYAASSPSLWRSPEVIKEALLGRSFGLQGGWVRHTVGELEQTMSPADLRLPHEHQEVRREHLAERRMVEYSRDVAAVLTQADLKYQFHVYQNQNHYSSAIFALRDAIEAMNEQLFRSQRMKENT